MWVAAMWGGIAGSAVLLGAFAAMVFNINRKLVGFIMAFGTGVLIGAAAYELLGDSVREGGFHPTAYGFLTGAIVYTLFEWIISRNGGSTRKRSNPEKAGKQAGNAVGIAIFIGTVMDAIPESVMIGSSLLESGTVSWLLVVAIFISNIPEGLSSTAGLRKSGYTRGKLTMMWISVLVISILASMAGNQLLAHASDNVMAYIASFAGGGIIAMLSSTMMPEAYEEGGPLIGLVTSFGLLASLLLDHLS